MNRKRNRQPNLNGLISEESTESCDETNTGGKCPHIPKAVNFGKLKKRINKIGITTECSTCKRSTTNCHETNRQVVPGTQGVSYKEEECTSNSAIWICLQCGHQGCGREENKHGLEHYKKPHSDCHFMVANNLHWTVWCYQCEVEVNVAYRKKLQDTIEFMKKSVSSAFDLSNTRAPTVQCQKEAAEIDNEREKFINSLPKGLVNLGNTCFFNAVLQCLAQTPYLIKVLEDLRLPGQKFFLPGGKHKAHSDSEEVELLPIQGTLEKWGNFTSVLHKTLLEMQSKNGHRTYCPSELLDSFKKKIRHCSDGGQHDAHELLRHLLELVRNEDLRRYQCVILKEHGLNEKTNPEEVEENLRSRVKFYGNQASAKLLGSEPVFRGVLMSTLECLDCHHSSRGKEPFLDLSLPVIANKPQPPILKRRNIGLEDTFDIVGNDISNAPSEYQAKKEKKAAWKNRKIRREKLNENQAIISKKNNIIKDNNGSILESEGSENADIEDNVEMQTSLPLIGESDYGSGKQSILARSIPSTAPETDANDTINKVVLPKCPILKSINKTLLMEPQNESQNTADLIQSNSFLMDLQLTDSNEVERSHIPEDLSSCLKEKSRNNTSITKYRGTEVHHLSDVAHIEDSEIENHKPSPWVDLKETCDQTDKKEVKQSCQIQSSKTRTTETVRNKLYNDVINEVTSEISRIGISDNTRQCPIRYSTKEGECSIQSCLNQFTALELLSGSNKVGCETCTARENKAKNNCKMVCTPSTKQYLISKVPAILILHLKRFQTQREDFRKVTKHVSFPMTFDLAPVCRNHRRSRIYALYGVVMHSGSIHGGHYVAYVKTRQPLSSDDWRWSFLPSREVNGIEEDSNSSSSDTDTEEVACKLLSKVEPPPGKWYYVSDTRVTEVDETTVLQSQAYLLFYERIL